MKSKTFQWLIAILAFIFFIATSIGIVEARGGGGGGFRGDAGGGDFRGGMDRGMSYHPEEEHPTTQYRDKDVQNWQHGNGYGYTHNGAHYNYYHNGNYFNYYHNGKYYNYYYKGNYYNYYNNGLYYLYFYNGVYYNTCNQVPPGYPNC